MKEAFPKFPINKAYFFKHEQDARGVDCSQTIRG